MERKHDPDATLHDWLDTFLDGWRRGDADLILRSLADDFIYDDPVDGRFEKAGFAMYLHEMLGSGEALVPAPGGAAFEDITDVATHEEDGELTAWGWWRTASEEGAGLVKVGSGGVRLEKTAYYSLPE
jgi:hypothetical protein